MTLSDFEKIQEKAKYKFICLCDTSNDFVVKYNNPSLPYEKRFTEIKNLLTSDALPDGNYFIKCKTSHYKDAKEMTYPIEKGEGITELKECAPDRVEMEEKPHILTYESALEMERRIIDLESENSQLAKELEEITEKCERLEGELKEAEAEALSEGEGNTLMTFIQESAPTIAQMFDRHYSVKEKELELLELQLKGKTQQPPQMQQAQLPTIEETLANIDTLLDSEEIDENQRAQGVANQMAILSELDPEIYEKVHAEVYHPATENVAE